MNLASGQKMGHCFSPNSSPFLGSFQDIGPAEMGSSWFFWEVLWTGFGGICWALGYKRGFGLISVTRVLKAEIKAFWWLPAYYWHLLQEEKEAKGSKVMWTGGSCISGGGAIAPVTQRWSFEIKKEPEAASLQRNIVWCRMNTNDLKDLNWTHSWGELHSKHVLYF